MSLETWRTKRKAKKAEKKIEKDEKKAEALIEANDIRVDVSHRREAVKGKMNSEEWFSRHLDEVELNRNIHEVRQNLFIQRDKLLRRMIKFNLEYKELIKKPDTKIRERELNRCSTGAKNAAYALSVVTDAIRRLDNVPSEYEWQEIMRDLTKGYKTVNAISIGSDIVTRLAFLFQKARLDIKGDLSVNAMEHYYGKSIDKLLAEEDIDQTATQLLVTDDALSLDDEDEILEAVRWGSIYSVQPQNFSDAAKEVNDISQKNHSIGSVFADNKPIGSINDIDMAEAVGYDDIPSAIH